MSKITYEGRIIGRVYEESGVFIIEEYDQKNSHIICVGNVAFDIDANIDKFGTMVCTSFNHNKDKGITEPEDAPGHWFESFTEINESLKICGNCRSRENGFCHIVNRRRELPPVDEKACKNFYYLPKQ